MNSLDLESLRAIKVLGKGAMGVVFLVHDPVSHRPLAVKVVDKSTFHLHPDAERRARWELSLLARLSSTRRSFLPHLISSTDSPHFLAWSITYCPGGDLNSLRFRQTDRMFPPAVIKFYAAEIVLAIEHLHDMGIVYRDLKPENVLIQTSGHVTLTDFDLSRPLSRRTVRSLIGDEPPPKHPGKKTSRVSPVTRRGSDRSGSFVGTDEYVSPEVIAGDGHEFSVDWWALGVLIYEMLHGTTPFKGKTRKATLHNIVSKPPEIIVPTSTITDLIRRLLEKDPKKRLGYCHGASEIKDHEFFRGLRWDQLAGVTRPPFIPATEEEKDTVSGGFRISQYFNKFQSPASSPPSPDYFSDF